MCLISSWAPWLLVISWKTKPQIQTMMSLGLFMRRPPEELQSQLTLTSCQFEKCATSHQIGSYFFLARYQTYRMWPFTPGGAICAALTEEKRVIPAALSGYIAVLFLWWPLQVRLGFFSLFYDYYVALDPGGNAMRTLKQWGRKNKNKSRRVYSVN